MNLELKIRNKNWKYTRKERLNGVRYEFTFENGYGASVVKSSDGSYGHEFDMWELAVLKGGKIHYDNEVANGDVRGWLYDNEVNDLLEKIEKFGEKKQIDNTKVKEALKKFILGRLESQKVEGFECNLGATVDEQDRYQAMDLVYTLNRRGATPQEVRDVINEVREEAQDLESLPEKLIEQGESDTGNADRWISGTNPWDVFLNFCQYYNENHNLYGSLLEL